LQIDASVYKLYGLMKVVVVSTFESRTNGVKGGQKTRMVRKRKLLHKVLSRSKDIRFNEMVTLVEAFGFRLSRVKGSHHIFVHPQVQELVNLQNVNGKAKPYQIRQFLRLVERYNLTLEGEEDES